MKIETMQPGEFRDLMNALVNTTNWERRMSLEKMEGYWNSLRGMPVERLRYALQTRHHKTFPSAGRLWELGREYQPEKATVQLPPKKCCTLRQALEDPGIKAHWKRLDPEMRQMFERMWR